MSSSGSNSRNHSSSSNSYSYNAHKQTQRVKQQVEKAQKQVERALRNIETHDWVPGDHLTVTFHDGDAIFNQSQRNNLFNGMFGLLRLPFLFLAGVLTIFAVIFTVLFRVLVGYNLEVGGRRYFLRAAQGDEKLSNTFSGIKSGTYVNVIGTMFLRSLYTFLWSLLFVIPGVIKTYAYRMVPYILAENPGMAPSEALAESVRLTNGHKMGMFVLDLSFIGWYILGSLVFGIGRVFVHPYVESTYAQLYLSLTGRGGSYTAADTPRDDYIDVRQN